VQTGGAKGHGDERRRADAHTARRPGARRFACKRRVALRRPTLHRRDASEQFTSSWRRVLRSLLARRSSKTPAGAGKHPTAAADTSNSYLRLKKVQLMLILSEAPNAQPQPAVSDLENFRMKTYQHMSENSARVSQQGFLAADQGIRGVQSFRDPSTGKTVELSSQRPRLAERQ